jgi:hypothetical protein
LYSVLSQEDRNLGQLLNNGNYLLCDNMGIIVRDLAYSILGKGFKESLEGCINIVTDGKHFIKYNFNVSYTTLFVEI